MGALTIEQMNELIMGEDECDMGGGKRVLEHKEAIERKYMSVLSRIAEAQVKMFGLNHELSQLDDELDSIKSQHAAFLWAEERSQAEGEEQYG